MTAPTSISARRSETTRSAILDAAGALIAEKGIDGFTISDVGQRAQVNRALIYHYFKNRDNLVAHAIDRIVERHEPADATMTAESVERGIRMHIRHPEIGRFVFQMLLGGRPLLRLGERIARTAGELERLREEHGGEMPFDPASALVGLVLLEHSWPFSRQEFARLLRISPDEADERFLSFLRWVTDLAFEAMTGGPPDQDGG